MRKLGNTHYYDFIHYFLSIVVGRRSYLKVCHIEKLSDYATKSDEALALLLFENSYDRWNDMYRQGNTKSSDVAPKYTNGGVSDRSKGRSRKYGGWSLEGLDRFDALYQMVSENRISKRADKFEEEYRAYRLDKLLEAQENKKGKNKNHGEIIEHRQKMVNNDLWSDDENNDKEASDDDSEASNVEECEYDDLPNHKRASV